MHNLTVTLNDSAQEPLYKQLYTHIKNEIEKGFLKAYAKLPSVRMLSQDLHVSKTTVEAAYFQLLAEGYIESKAKSGYYVVDIGYTFPNNPSSYRHTVETGRIRHSKHVDNRIKYDFHGAKIDEQSFPVSVFRKLAADTLNDRSSFYFYGNRQGELPLRESLAAYLHHGRIVFSKPEQIVIGSGTEQAMGLLCELFSTDYDTIAMENPGFSGLRKICHAHRYKVVPISVEKDGINIDELRKSKAKLLYITPSHQYPLGMAIPIKKRMQLLKWAEETDSYIIEDDYDGEFRYNVRPLPSLQGLDQNGRVIYLGTFSKALSPAVRVNYLVLPESVLHKYRTFNVYPSSVSVHMQHILAMFMARGHWGQHIRRMRKIYSHKHSILLKAIKNTMGNNVKIFGEHAGLHIVLEIQSRFTEEHLASLAELTGVKVYPVTHHWLTGPKGFPKIILGFGGLDTDEIKAGILRLDKAWFS